jgi:hypothetical protein
MSAEVLRRDWRRALPILGVALGVLSWVLLRSATGASWIQVSPPVRALARVLESHSAVVYLGTARALLWRWRSGWPPFIPFLLCSYAIRGLWLQGSTGQAVLCVFLIACGLTAPRRQIPEAVRRCVGFAAGAVFFATLIGL